MKLQCPIQCRVLVSISLYRLRGCLIEFIIDLFVYSPMKERARGTSAQLNSSHSSVTQPVGENRSGRRMEQIEALHMQFEDLKKKIKDVENKNERIIENIHKRYDFKKKPTTMESLVDNTPIVYYEQPMVQTHIENQSVASNDSECDFHISKPVVRKTSNIRKNLNQHHQSMQYRKTEHQLEREHSDTSSKSGYPLQKQTSSAPYYVYGAASQARTQQSPTQNYQLSQYSQGMPFQMSMQFPPYPSMGYPQMEQAYQTQSSYQMDSAIRKERDKIKLLEQELEEKEEESITLKRLQKKIKNLSNEYNDRMEDMLEQFMQQVVESRFGEIEKHVKKTENKLKRLQLVIKDKDEQFRSLRNINEHRYKRSHSRKRDASPMTPTYNSLPRNPRKTATTHQPPAVETPSATKSKQSDNSKSSMQFEQIASKYEEMIKTKTKELESSQARLKKKEKELVDLSTKFTALELKLSELEQIPPRAKQMSKFSSGEREDNLLANLDFETEKDAQIKKLSRTIADLEQQIGIRDQQLKEKDACAEKITKKMGDLELKAKKNEAEAKRLKEQLKKLESTDKEEDELVVKLKRLENELQGRQKEFALTKEKYLKVENEKIEKQCQNMTLTNRLKKIEQLLHMKEEKISELEKIIQSTANNELPDLLERSVIVDKNDQHDLHQLQEEKEKLQEELTRKEEEVFKLRKSQEQQVSQVRQYEQESSQLKKEIQNLLIQNESMKINLKALQFEKYSQKSEPKGSPLQKLLLQNECISQNEENSVVRQQLQQLRGKYEESQRQLKAQKHESLQFNTRLIKMNSEVSYYRDLLSERETKYERIRKELEESKCMVSHLQQTVQDRQNQLQIQKKQNSQKIMELETQWLEFEQEMRTKEQLEGSGHTSSDMRSSRNFSEESFVGYKTTFNTMNAQNEHLNEKIKEAEKIIEIQKEMETKIMNEYRTNVEKIKGELRQKVRESEQLAEEVDNLRRKVKVIEQTETRMRSMAEAQSQEGADHGAKIYQLQLQLGELREIKNKQEAVQQELFKQIGEKEQENESLVRLISSKEKKIEQLEDIIELKELNVNFNSNISSSNYKSKIKDSIQSNSSLKYSMLSNNPNRTIDLELSEAGESFYEQNQSMISNVSEVFGRDEFPYQKMQLRRVEQRRLFEKTAAYIKSLKTVIEEKNKKIKLLEKKIQSLRNSQLIRKDIYQIKDMQDVEATGDEEFKDYSSVQNVRTSSQRYRLKQLEHETKLTIQQNFLLNNQIESLQDQLLKAEEQENSLMKLKDLYKDEIKSLIKKNQEQAKAFEEEVRRERQKVEQSQSVQRMQALKLLFVRIMTVVVSIYNEPSKSKRVQEHRKELEDSSKVLFNFLNIQEATREKLLNEIKK